MIVHSSYQQWLVHQRLEQGQDWLQPYPLRPMNLLCEETPPPFIAVNNWWRVYQFQLNFLQWNMLHDRIIPLEHGYPWMERIQDQQNLLAVLLTSNMWVGAEVAWITNIKAEMDRSLYSSWDMIDGTIHHLWFKHGDGSIIGAWCYLPNSISINILHSECLNSQLSDPHLLTMIKITQTNINKSIDEQKGIQWAIDNSLPLSVTYRFAIKSGTSFIHSNPGT